MLDKPRAQTIDFVHLASSTDAWLHLDTWGRLRSASSTAARMFGHSAGSALVAARPNVDALFVDHSFFQSITQGDDAPQSLWLASLAGGEINAVGVRLLQRDGDWHCQIEPRVETTRISRALHDERVRFTTVTDAIASGIFMSDGERFIYVNAAGARMLGYQKEELLGMECSRILSAESDRRLDDVWNSLEDDEPLALTTAELIMKNGVDRKIVSLSLYRIEYDGRPVCLSVMFDATDTCVRERVLRDYARRLRRLSRQVLEVQENERRNLARELHDEIGQQLTFVKLSLSRLARSERGEPVDDALNAVSSLMQQVRTLSLDLRPSMLDDLGLGATLRWYVGRITQLSALETHLEIDPLFPRLSCEAETLFFRVAQEAITNIMRHAAARTLRLTLTCTAEAVELRIADDGVGFSPDLARCAASEGRSSGLLGMHERAALGGAELTIESKQGLGTSIRLVMPVMLAGVHGEPS